MSEQNPIPVVSGFRRVHSSELAAMSGPHPIAALVRFFHPASSELLNDE